MVVVWYYKTNTMSANQLNREILLIKGTSFTTKELSGNIPGGVGGQNFMKGLEHACWAGLLCDLLPKIAKDRDTGTDSYTWHVLTARHFLLICQGEIPGPVESATSVDPHLFTPMLILN